MLIVAVLLATVILRFALVTAVVYCLLPRGALCPRCRVPMAAIKNRVLEVALPPLQRRWCLQCGWNGVVRRDAGSSPHPAPYVPTPPPTWE